MYKININENILYLLATDEVDQIGFSKNSLIAPYSGKTKMLLSYIDMMEKTHRFDQLVLHYHDVRKMKTEFESLFTVIRASGGVVEDENEKVLMIFRRGYWDLPKGKIENGENKRQAAIREVMEETGVKKITLLEKITTTRHCYRLRNKTRILKKTYWYAMKAPNQKLVPQTGEDIEKAIWTDPNKIIKKNQPIFSNIVDVLEDSGHL
jgi:8-oxo-dGTP pyrophosphatase MutT (NUDIX family)